MITNNRFTLLLTVLVALSAIAAADYDYTTTDVYEKELLVADTEKISDDSDQDRCAAGKIKCPDGSCAVTVSECPVDTATVKDVTGEIFLEDGREMQKDAAKAVQKAPDLMAQEKTLSTTKSIDKATPALAKDISSKDFTADDKKELKDYLSSKEELLGADFGLAIAYVASGNERVKDVSFDNKTNTTTVEYKEDARLFGLIPVRMSAKSKIDSDGAVSTSLPWWSALAVKTVSPLRWMAPEALIGGGAEAKIERNELKRVLDGVNPGEEVHILGMQDEK
jgi:hypothetical protein